jgi:hypothetical protein
MKGGVGVVVCLFWCFWVTRPRALLDLIFTSTGVFGRGLCALVGTRGANMGLYSLIQTPKFHFLRFILCISYSVLVNFA